MSDPKETRKTPTLAQDFEQVAALDVHSRDLLLTYATEFLKAAFNQPLPYETAKLFAHEANVSVEHVTAMVRLMSLSVRAYLASDTLPPIVTRFYDQPQTASFAQLLATRIPEVADELRRMEQLQTAMASYQSSSMALNLRYLPATPGRREPELVPMAIVRIFLDEGESPVFQATVEQLEEMASQLSEAANTLKELGQRSVLKG